LRRRFQRAAGLSDEEIGMAAPEAAASAVPPAPVAAAPAETKSPVHEVDLSDEWASMLATEAPTGAPPKVSAPPPPPPKPQAPEVSEFEIPIEAPGQQSAAPSPTPPAAEPRPASSDEEFAFELVEEGSGETPMPPPAVEADASGVPSEIQGDQEYELVLTPEETAEPPTADTLAGSHALESDQFLADLANEIDQLGLEPLAPTPSEAPGKAAEPAAPQPVAKAPVESGEPQPLKEVFEDFRAELGEMGAEDEDLETHYNLGIAFREMGLLEEAISEFQKVAKANENGKAFRYAMQCCTLLGLAFMEKGQPSIAAIWYERALRTPGVDSESIMALRYDLGVAQESANDLDAALKSFSQVYAMNIDYRDVADRITALQKTTR